MKNTKRIFYTCLIPVLGLGLSACTSSSGDSNDSLSVSGTLSLGNGTQSVQIEKVQSLNADDVSIMSVDITSYKVTCATTTAPVQSATATIASDGTFTVNIAGAKEQPLSCFLVDADGDKAADFVISDSSKKDMNGNAQTTSTAAYKQNANLGTITFDPNSGEVTVPKANIASAVSTTVAASGQVFDPSGAWTISSVDFTVPNGVKSPCANNNECHGPPEGQAIYLKLWKGLVTADSSDVYGLQVWQGENAYNTCGGKIGLTSTMKTDLGVDFSANGSADSTFTFASSVASFHDQVSNSTGTVNLTEGWKMSTATTQYDMNPSCAPHDISVGGVTYSNAWVCGPDNNGRYQGNLEGGCVDSDGKAVNLTDWTGVNSCQTTTDSNGVQTNQCSGSATINGQSKTVTCKNKWVVTNSSYIVQNGVNFNWNDLNAAKISSGTSCSSIANGASSESLKIAQLQCYADYYYRSGMESANACLPRVDMDWSASTSANFAVVDKIRPQGLIFFEKFAPFPDGSGGTLMTRQEHYEGVNVSGNNWVNCRVIDVGGLTIKKISSTKLLATYQSSLITTSILKPACLAKFNGTRESYLFYLNK